MAGKMIRLIFVVAVITGTYENIFSQDAAQYRIGITYGSSLRTNADRYEFSLNGQETIVMDSANPVVYFKLKLSPGQSYSVTQLSGPRTCNLGETVRGTITDHDISLNAGCGTPPLTLFKLNVTGVGPGETFSFKDNFGRSFSYPFSTIASIGGFPKGAYYSITQTSGPRPCRFTYNQGTVPDNSITILADCRKVVPSNPPPTIKYDLVSRSTDNKITATYYETANPVIGGMSDAAGGNEGRYVAFVSYTKGIDGSSGKYRQIFWRDRTTGETKLISRSATGEEANGDCHAPSISAEGTSVAFESYASNLSTSDQNGARDIFIWNQGTGKVLLVSKTASGESGNSESMEPAVSGNGNVIAFSSNASNIDPASTGGVNVFVHDLQTGTTILISKDYETGKGAGGSVPSISEDGTRIAFCSATNRLVKNDNNNLWDIFLWQKGAEDLKRISMTSAGGERDQGTESSSRVVAPAISGDGKMIVYATTATNVVPGDMNGMQDIFLYNIETGTVKRISTDKNAAEGNGDSPIDQGARAGISYDGSWISFNTNATNLGVPKGNIIVKHTIANEILPITNTTSGSTARPMLSRFGLFVIAGTSEKYDTRYPSSGIFTFYTNATTPKDAGTNASVQPPAPVTTNMQVIKDTIPKILRPVLIKDTLASTIPNDVDFPNWDFEKGLTGWTKEGTAFNNQPTFGDNVVTNRILNQMELNNGGIGGDYWKDQGYNIGRHSNNWLGTYENNPYTGGSFFQTQGDAPTGVLTSTEFIITTSNCYFLIGGGADAQKLYVELQIKQPDGNWSSAGKKTSFRNNEIMYRERIDLAAFKGKTARIKIVDNSNGNWGHINIDNFRFTNQVLDGITLRDNTAGRNYEVDVNTPVWGIADTHAHPAHDEGFGKLLITGKATTSLQETYSNDLCITNHGALGTFIMRKPFIMGADPHLANGWPDFIDFPRFNSKTHQQQHVEFLKRAFDGGMRLFCALAINNMYVPSLLMGPGNDGTPFDDETVLMKQIELIKQMVLQNSSWMEIALSPKDARRIILQGKMAIVLGIEADNLGNFKAPSYNWVDKNTGALWNNPLIPLTDANADVLLDAKLTDYRFKGIRQLTPIHYISGLFGGAAVFRAELAVMQAAFNNDVKVKSGVDKHIPFSLYADFTMLTTFSNPPIVTKDAYSTLIKSFNGGPTNLSTINLLGLTNVGTKLIQKMMVNGFIIDGEHMSYETKENVFSLAAARGYPVISSHTDPAGLSMNWTGSPVEFKDNGGPKENQIFNQQNFGTTNIRNLANEFEMADEHFAKITNSGGTAGVFMLPYYKNAYSGFLGSVPNDCAGTTKTFAQMYLYTLEKMNIRGVGLASDRGMTDFIGPRFGPNAAYGLRDEKLLSMRINKRKEQRLVQRNGVRYDVPMTSYHPEWYENLDMRSGLLTILDEIVVSYEEEDMWKAFTAYEAGIGVGNVPLSREVIRLGRIKNFYEGLTAAAMDNPVLKTTPYFEKAAMFCVKNNVSISSLPGFNNWLPNDKEFIMTLHNAIVPVWQTWQSKTGNNQPLRRYKTGNRYWDFNTDGMAHYGMMPDFLQDLRNIGIQPGILSYLFRSAEDYIQMWEKTEKASGTAPAQQTPILQSPIPIKKTDAGLIKIKKQ